MCSKVEYADSISETDPTFRWQLYDIASLSPVLTPASLRTRDCLPMLPLPATVNYL